MEFAVTTRIDWNVRHFEPLDTKRLFVGQDQFFPLTFSNDGRYLACFAGDWPVLECDTGRVAYTIPDTGNYGIAFSPKDTYLAACTPEEVNLIRHANARNEINLRLSQPYDAGLQSAVFPTVFAQDEGIVAFIAGRFAQAWRLPGGSEIRTLTYEGDENVLCVRELQKGVVVVFSRQYSTDNHRVASTEFVSGRRNVVAQFGGARYGPIAVSPRGQLLASANTESGCYDVWSLSENKLICQVPERHVTAGAVHVSDSGRLLVSGSSRIWDALTAELLCDVIQAVGAPARLHYCPATGILAAVRDGRAATLDAEIGRTIFIDTFTGETVGESALPHIPHWEDWHFSPNGRWFATVSGHNYFRRVNEPLYPMGTIILTDLAPILAKSDDRRRNCGKR